MVGQRARGNPDLGGDLGISVKVLFERLVFKRAVE